MNWEKRIEILARRARSERPPQVDVAQSVLSLLASGQAEPITVAERLWMWLAAASAAVAVPAAVIAVTLYNASSGPLPELVDSIAWVM
jgi:hypothetical protein